MTRITLAVALALATALPITSAQAQITRSFVSAASGSDSNPCSRTAPCRSFQHAHDVTNAGGEINTLDPGGYGSVTITKSISIVSGLGEAGVLVPSGADGITVNAGPNDKISLRGLVIEGAGVGTHGILFLSGRSLSVLSCFIRNVTNQPIKFEAQVSSSLFISDTTLSDSGDAGLWIVPIKPVTVSATLNRVQVINNTYGIWADTTYGSGAATINAAVMSSVIAGNSSSAFNVYPNSQGGNVTVVVRNSDVVNNGGNAFEGTKGQISTGLATYTLTQSMAANNQEPTSNTICIFTFGNNALSWNAGNIVNLCEGGSLFNE
jgi:hypothetical protein